MPASPSAGPVSLTGEAIGRWLRIAADNVAATRAALNTANVFPVADADTGTNLWLTLDQSAREAETDSAAGASAAQVLHRAYAGAAQGARGNSGAIWAQFLGGIAADVADAPGDGTVSARRLASAFATGAARALASVGAASPGTIVTAAQEVAAGAADACAGGDGAPAAGRPAGGASSEVTLLQVVEAAVAAAEESVRRSPDRLPVLAKAGVVDSGAAGLLIILESLREAIGGQRAERDGFSLDVRAWRAAAWSPAEAGTPDDCAPAAADDVDLHDDGDLTAGQGSYEVMCVATPLDDEADVDQLQDFLATVGDSVVVIATPAAGAAPGGQALAAVRVHVHTDDVGAVLELGAHWRGVEAVIHHLAYRRVSPVWAFAAITDAAGTAQTLAEAGAVVLWARDGHVDHAGIRRAVVDAGAEQVVLVCGTLPGISAARVAEIAQRVAAELSVRVDVIAPQRPGPGAPTGGAGEPTDVHALVATATMAEAVVAVTASAAATHGHGDGAAASLSNSAAEGAAVAALAQQAVDGLPVVSVPDATVETMTAIVTPVIAGIDPPGFAVVVPDDAVDDAVVAAGERLLIDRGWDVTVIDSGRGGQGVVIGFEGLA